MLLKESMKSLLPRSFRRAARRLAGRPVPDPVQELQHLGVLWEAERIDREAERLSVSGWLIAPAGREFRLTADGREIEEMAFVARPDIEAEYPFLAAEPSIRIRGFAGQASSLPGLFRLQFTQNGEAIGSIFWSGLDDGDIPWPDSERRERVHGQADLAKFRTAGATAFAQLREGLRSIAGLDYPDLPEILDWGCGCGRITRHFAPLPVRVTGVDVLADNVAWLRQHLPFGRYEIIPQSPPISLPTAAFDLAIGVSTFTYLTEDRQFEWLAELRRVVRPGGYLLATVQGETALVLGRVGLRQYRRFLRKGIIDRLEEGPDGYLPELGDYRGTFHSEAYIRREWGRYFEVLAVLPNQVGLQDLLVLRRCKD